MTKIGQLLTAMVTPFAEDGAVDYGQAQKLALALIASGSDGVLVSGSTGEHSTLTHEESKMLFQKVKEAVGTKGTVIAGSGSNNTAEGVALTQAAEKVGVDACLLVVPYYNKPTQEGLYQHFKAIADSTKLPCILYNVPSRTVTNMTAETVIRLSKVANIIGIKEASGNMEQISLIIGGVSRKDFMVWSGNDGDTLPVLALGGCGVVSVASHLVGKQIKQMIDSFAAGKIDQARAIHHRLLPLVKAMFVVTNPIPVKYAVNAVGFRVGKPRMPLMEPDEKSAAFIRDILKKHTIDLPVS
ncbi:MAG: 4-hydroxy-tetrahydrodipicolinate synthase [Chloroflexota bacterium]